MWLILMVSWWEICKQWKQRVKCQKEGFNGVRKEAWNTGASFEGAVGPPPPQGKITKEKKKERKRKKRKKKKERKKGTMNNVKLLHYKVLFFPIFQ